MQLSHLLFCVAAFIGSTVALPTGGPVELEGYTGAGGKKGVYMYTPLILC
jgi:hypothetical protein